MFKRTKKQKVELFFKNSNYLELVKHNLHKLLALIHRKSIHRLIEYINNHPVSKDQARREVLHVKMLYANASRPFQVLSKSVSTDPERFTKHWDHDWYLDYNEYEFYITDVQKSYTFKIEYIIEDNCSKAEGISDVFVNEGSKSLLDSLKLSQSEYDKWLFIYTYETLVFLHDNKEKLKSELDRQSRIEGVIEAYE